MNEERMRDYIKSYVRVMLGGDATNAVDMIWFRYYMAKELRQGVL